ncbi:PepSY domain-containing protein [Hyphomonas johnsonii]|jgi:uncharacterized membrane protein YkoI|uniref:PepSY domain-containing protein n=1 Tax=Hyphomonas johnsonii MHS-2 TaxID=1280950 RepID=A0A059FT33_9PROT|nr:hypothetical protein [Hyphomonas johnsonii]KCZ93777.1 hypothetical protein HJO_00335 [Hyphomonas johnsonii MHS-2]
MKRIIASLAILGLFAAGPALAQPKWGDSFSPGQAREAVRDGKTVPLSKIFQNLKREYGGYQLSADLFSKSGGGAEYHIDWMTGDGHKVRFVVDAQSGTITNRRGS